MRDHSPNQRGIRDLTLLENRPFPSHVPLITRSFLFFVTISLLTILSAHNLQAADGTLPSHLTLEGNYCIAHGGVGLFDGGVQSFQLTVVGTPVHAYAYWSGRYEDDLDGDDRIRITFNDDGGRPVRAIAGEVASAGFRRGGVDIVYHTYRSDNIVDELPATGQIDVKVNNLLTPEAHGAGIVVISTGPECAYSRVQLNFGLDGFFWNFPPEAGPDTQVTCSEFPAATVDRTLEMQMFIGGVEHDAERADRIWYATGSGPPPTDIIAIGNPANVLDGPVPPDILPPPAYPLTGENGDWDDYSNSITVPAGDTYACFQIESIDRIDRTYPNGTSGVWLELMTRLIDAPGIDLIKLTNGNDAKAANDSDVPVIAPGAQVTWTYLVTNTGQLAFAAADVTLTDTVEGVITNRLMDRVGNNDAVLEPGETWVFQQTGTALPLQATATNYIVNGCGNVTASNLLRNTYANRATVSATTLTNTVVVTATDTSHYCNPLVPGIAVLKLTNGNDAKRADAVDVPVIDSNSEVRWTYLLTNTGQTIFLATEITLIDSVEGSVTNRIADRVGNGDSNLEPDETWTYEIVGTALWLADAADLFVVTGCGGNGSGAPRNTYGNSVTAQVGQLSATDTSHYCNPEVLTPGIALLKLTNGNDAKEANDSDVPVIVPNTQVVWTYLVTNTGEVTFDVSDITLIDNVEGTITFRLTDRVGNNDTLLEPGETWVYQQTGTALTLRETAASYIVNGCSNNATGDFLRNTYANLATVTATSVTPIETINVTATDTSHYCNPLVPGLAVLKLTNGNDAKNANDADIPVLAARSEVVWTYLVTNTGQTTFTPTELTLNDSVEGLITNYVGDAVGDGDDLFEPGESRLYSKTGTVRDLSSTSGAFVVNGCGNGATGGIQRNTYTNQITVEVDSLTATDTSHYCNPLPTATVGNRVWGDIDPGGITPAAIVQGDGIQDNDSREQGIDGILVELRASTGALIRTAITDIDGTYLFTDVVPGEYYLVFINPKGEGVWTLPNQGTDDAIDSDVTVDVTDPRGNAKRTEPFTLEPGEIDLSWDAGLIGLSGAGSAVVGNFVWNDQNRNGVQDGGEEVGVADVVVRLYRGDGTLVTEVRTDNNGFYSFSALDPGEYYIEFILPNDFQISPQNSGTDDEIDSDFDPTTGRTERFTIPAFTTDLRWDAGIFRPTNLGHEEEPVRLQLFLPLVVR